MAKKKPLPKYEYVTLKSHTDHKKFMQDNIVKFMEDHKQCSSQTTDKCKSKSGVWRKEDFYRTDNEIFDDRYPICKDCLIELTNNNAGELSKKGLIRIATVLDIPFIQDVYEGALKAKGRSIGVYFKNLMLNHKDKTFIHSDRGLDELVMEADNGFVTDDIVLDDELFMKWGRHYEKADILSLEYKYMELTTNYRADDLITMDIFKEIAYTELELSQARAKGVDTSKLVKKKVDLIGSAQLKPEQQNKNTDSLKGIGTIIKQIEENEPIPQPDPIFKDVDRINWYVQKFFGQIFKVFGRPLEVGEEPNED